MSLMVNLHCTGKGPGHVQGPNGNNHVEIFTLVQHGDKDPLEIFLNVFTEFYFNSVTKIFVIKRNRTCHLLCKRLGCYYSASRDM